MHVIWTISQLESLSHAEREALASALEDYLLDPDLTDHERASICASVANIKASLSMNATPSQFAFAM